MRVALGTMEVDDDVRRLIRRSRGKDGLASRKEVRLAVAVAFDDAIAAMHEEQAEYQFAFMRNAAEDEAGDGKREDGDSEEEA